MNNIRHFNSTYSNFGEDGYGHTVKLFGDTTGKYVNWNSSADKLEVIADTTITGNIDQTGNHTMTGNQTITGNLSVTGNFSVVDAVQAVVGGTSVPDAADLTNNTYQSVSSTSDAIKKYLLSAPVAGTVKKLLCTKAQSTSPVYVYASASSAYTAYFGGNTSGNILTIESNYLSLELTAQSSMQWLITNVSTYNSTGTIAIASSNT